jgi:hypothetical protein
MSVTLAATHDKYKVRELWASEVKSVTSTGVVLLVVVPSPSWPWLFMP